MKCQLSYIDYATEPCPLCKSSLLEKLFLMRGEQFVRCRSCKLTHINPKPSSKTIRATYLTGYSDSYRKKSVKKLKRANRYVNRIKNHYKRQGKWLDIGCSAGFVVKACQENGFEGHGIDIDPGGISHAREKLHLSNLKLSTLEDAAYVSQYFDVISAYDVIEHVEDIHIFTAELKRLLAPDGIIDLITPNVSHWRVPKILEGWKEIKPSEHLYYFDKNTLAQLLDQHGLRIAQTRFTLKATMKLIITHKNPIALRKG